MKKLTTILLSSLFFVSTAYAGGMIGIKAGMGDLSGERTSTGEGGSKSSSVDSEYGAIFAEINLADSPVSLGFEIVPMEGVIDTKSTTGTDSHVTVSDLMTLYLLGSMETEFGTIYGKLGYSSADLSAKANYGQTLSNMSDAAEGPMVGVGAQFDVTNEYVSALINTVRLEATYARFDDLKITSTDEDGGAAENRTGDAELTTLSISLARSF